MNNATATARTYAEKIVDELSAKISDRKMRLRIWEATGFVRIYTGFGSEFIEVQADGTTTTSRDRMTWGHIISEVLV